MLSCVANLERVKTNVGLKFTIIRKSDVSPPSFDFTLQKRPADSKRRKRSKAPQNLANGPGPFPVRLAVTFREKC